MTNSKKTEREMGLIRRTVFFFRMIQQVGASFTLNDSSSLANSVFVLFVFFEKTKTNRIHFPHISLGTGFVQK